MEISAKFTAGSSLEAAGRQHGEEYTSLMSLNQSDEEENNDIPEGDKSQSTDSQTDSEEIMRGVCCSGLYNIKVFLLLICLFSIIHGFAINGINNVNIPMYERRYHLTSTQSGLEASFYDISACFLVLIVGYVAPRYNQPRLIGAGLLVLSLGSLIMVLPHFLSGEYKPSDVPPAVCLISQGNQTDGRCDEKDEKLSSYLYLFLLAQLLHGLSGVALYTLAPPYIDGSVSNKQSPLYMGLFYSSATLGPGIGYILGGYFLSLYVDIPKPPPHGQTKESPEWVGAWWIGFLITSALSILVAIPLLTFPRVLPGTTVRRRNNKNQAHTDGSTRGQSVSPMLGASMRDMPAAAVSLFRNPVFVCQCLTSSLSGMTIAGLSTFAIKFLVNQFNQDTGSAAMLTGLILIPAAVLGQAGGGYIIKRYNLQIRAQIKLGIGVSILLLITTGALFMRCDQNDIAGVNYSYNRSVADQIGLEGFCNRACGCDSSVYDPVCMSDVEYMTPCHAGCPLDDKEDTHTSKDVYYNCSCGISQSINSSDSLILYLPGSSDNIMSQTTATKGRCGQSCPFYYVFLPCMFLTVVFLFATAVPYTNIVLRCVEDRQRTFAVAVKQFIIRVCGTIPGPLLYGATFDRACLVWQEKCEQRGSCWIYDSKELGLSFFILTASASIVSIILLILAHCLYKPPRTVTESNEDDSVSVTLWY